MPSVCTRTHTDNDSERHGSQVSVSETLRQPSEKSLNYIWESTLPMAHLHKSNAIIQARIYNTKCGPVFGFLLAVGFLLWWKSPNDGMECSTGPDWQRRPQALENRLCPTWGERQRHWHLSCLWVVPWVGGWASPSRHLHCWGRAGSVTGRQPRHQWWDLFDFPMVN